MQQQKKSVTARIPKELYDKCNQQYANMTDAVIDGLELLCNQNCKTSVITIEELNAQIEERDVKIKELQNLNNSLVKELENHKEPEILQIQNIRIQELQDQLSKKDENQKDRITDLKEQIQSLNEQINKKDKLLEELNQTLLAQASNIYNLTQNPKLLPENKVKRWWEFWKN
jgi:hypothetical protein